MNSAGYYMIGLLLIVIGVLAWLRVRPGAKDGMQPGEVIHLLVTAAEQMLPGYSGESKLEWVLAELKELGLNLDPRLARMMVESTVYFLKQNKVLSSSVVLNPSTVTSKETTTGVVNPNSPLLK